MYRAYYSSLQDVTNALMLILSSAVGPVVEAFGYQRIIFGSSPSSTNSTTSAPGDWYEIARESFAELGVEQEAIDSVFAINAKKLYGES